MNPKTSARNKTRKMKKHKKRAGAATLAEMKSFSCVGGLCIHCTTATDDELTIAQ